jgi:hypothetical protein
MRAGVGAPWYPADREGIMAGHDAVIVSPNVADPDDAESAD